MAKVPKDWERRLVELAAIHGVTDFLLGGRLTKAESKVFYTILKKAGPLVGRAAVGTGRLAGASVAGAARPLLANPYVAGAALGYGALQTPPGQDLLAWAEEKGKRDRVAYEQYKTDVAMRMREFADDPIGYSQDVIAAQPGEGYGPGGIIKPITGRLLPGKKQRSKYNKAMSAALKAVKNSTKGGKKGTISPAKSVFKTVSKVVSKVNKGAKVSPLGISGIAAKAARKILGKKKKSKKKTKKRGATYTYRK